MRKTMYHFRYHVLTIAGIFLSLGIGMFLGTVMAPEWMTKQQAGILQRLESRYHSLLEQQHVLQEKTDQLEKESSSTKHELRAVESHYIANRLSGKHILVISVTSVDTSEMIESLREAGAEITWNVQVSQLGALLNNALNEEQVSALGWSKDCSQSELYVNSLVNDLLSGNETHLQSLERLGLLEIMQHAAGQPDHVILAGGTYSADSSQWRAGVRQFDQLLIRAFVRRQLPIVTAERSDSKEMFAKWFPEYPISTIDNIDHPAGQIALIDVLNGAHGHYGTKAVAKTLLPDGKMSKEVFGQ
ncbi:copper transporter [Fodinisporobacter ferrooxydans]|uniref:Copper transporter n=1 Tax=Fodinisporobacter ferrooxydans TaxID=2901836 RepID=A0ABY4CHM4_9BACL|nr:copper transporter [Alicyclobacillaceae bacterium MYW30-H2]